MEILAFSVVQAPKSSKPQTPTKCCTLLLNSEDCELHRRRNFVETLMIKVHFCDPKTTY